jgi:hypothetical protein
MKKPKKRAALKIACLQAASAVWASGKLHEHYSSQNPQAQADAIADFALLLYQAWVNKQSESEDAARPSGAEILRELDRRIESSDKDHPTPSSGGKAP